LDFHYFKTADQAKKIKTVHNTSGTKYLKKNVLVVVWKGFRF